MDPATTQAKDELERYVHDALGTRVSARPWRGQRRLPHLLRSHYAFAEIVLLRARCILMIDTEGVERSPTTVRKHVQMVQAKSDATVVYVRVQVTAYHRKRLIEQKVPFVVPGRQMYLPMLGIDLREHFNRLRAEVSRFSPATQALVIHVLLRQTTDVLTPTAAADRLGYSAMTMTRAFDELHAAHVGEIKAQGRARRLCFQGGRRLIWSQAKPFMRSPVAKRLYIEAAKPHSAAVRAGLSALAQYSTLAPPAHAVVALGRDAWRDWRKRVRVTEIPEPKDAALEVEVWRYRPALRAKDKLADPFSLYLSLQDSSDERIEAALEEMMDRIAW